MARDVFYYFYSNKNTTVLYNVPLHWRTVTEYRALGAFVLTLIACRPPIPPRCTRPRPSGAASSLVCPRPFRTRPHLHLDLLPNDTRFFCCNNKVTATIEARTPASGGACSVWGLMGAFSVDKIQAGRGTGIRVSSETFFRWMRRYFKDLESPAPSQHTSTTASFKSAVGPEDPPPFPPIHGSSSSGTTEAQKDAGGLASIFTLFTHY